MKNKLIVIIIIMILSVNLFCENQKSVKKAVLLSAILPGAGQLYSQNYTRMGTFFASESAIWFCKARFKQEEKWAQNSCDTYAYKMAGVPMKSDKEHYTLVANYTSSEDYNNKVELAARNYYLIYAYDPEAYEQYIMENTFHDQDSWEWKTNEDRMQFKELRRRKQRYSIYDNFTVGALVINRIISVIDAGKSAKSYNRHHVYASPTETGKGLSLNYEYKF